jgi:hypothetical protein
VLRVPCSFPLALPGGITLGCKQAAVRPGRRRRWEIRSAGTGSKGERWYARAWLGTASARHHLLTRRHLATGELAFHYCYLPDGQPASPSRPVRAAGLRWPAEDYFEFGKDSIGPDQSQVRLYTAIGRHTVLVMAAVAICAITAALLRRRTDTPGTRPGTPGPAPPAEFGMIPLTVPETGPLLSRPPPPGSAENGRKKILVLSIDLCQYSWYFGIDIGEVPAMGRHAAACQHAQGGDPDVRLR